MPRDEEVRRGKILRINRERRGGVIEIYAIGDKGVDGGD